MVWTLLVFAATSSSAWACTPLEEGQIVLPVVKAADPALERYTVLARAIIADTAPFVLAKETQVDEALTAEGGLRERRQHLEEARGLVERAEQSFSELEDRAALDLVAEVTPLLVAVQAEPEARALLARAHLLAGAIFVARGRLDAATQRLERALDLDPDIAPPANLRLLGALEGVRARSLQRGRGALVVDLAETATRAEVFLDGRPVGLAPGRFEDIPAGRHLVRVSAPDRRSHAGTIAVLAARDSVLEVHLSLDRVRAGFRSLGARLAAGESLKKAEAQLSQRASVDRTLVAAVVPSSQRAKDGTVAIGLILDLEEAGRSRVETLEPSLVGRALQRLAVCDESVLSVSPLAAIAAPPLPYRSPPRLGQIGPTPEPSPVWRSPWFWAVVGIAAVGLAGGLAAAQGASAAPDRVSITLIPRP